MEDKTKNLAGITGEIAKDVYTDLGKPVAQTTGKALDLIPRAIKAALLPVEKWVLGKEYNLEATRKLLEQKLANTPEELIESPEPYVAVPALQSISYCMDNDELRELYANLLASSMTKEIKNGVHPGFVDIIKQLSPDEAKILKYFKSHDTIPTISLRFNYKNGSYNEVVTDFSTIGEDSSCEKPYDTKMYFDNLIRLGLIEKSNGVHLTNKELYKPLKEHERIKDHIFAFESFKTVIKKVSDLEMEFLKQLPQYENYTFEEGFMKLTSYGVSFCNICIDS